MKQAVSKKRTSKATKKYDPNAVAKMATVMPISKIAETVGVHRTTVMRFLKAHEIDCNITKMQSDMAKEVLINSKVGLDVKHRVLKHYQDMSEDTFRALSDATKTKILDSANNSSGTDFDKFRLLTNQSTENVSIISRLANDLKQSLKSNDND